jgi:DNA-binding NtrC family response regulator
MGSALRVLLVDGDRSSSMIMQEITSQWGFRVSSCRSVADAAERIDDGGVDVVVTDLSLPDGSGLEVVRHAHEVDNPVGSIVISAHGTISSAVEAIRLGAYDFLTKPVDLAKLKAILPAAHEKARLRLENRQLRSRISEDARPEGLVGQSAAIRQVIERIHMAAAARATVLITGESGTGKELIATAIHRLSPRADGPLVKVACGALSPQLLESELFGHERGAFTGAIAQRRGRFELAHGGTLFLDEIDGLDVSLQGKLLRALEERQFERVGGEQTITTDVRLIAATNADPEKMVDGGTLRKDFFYRVNVVRIEAPALRDRREDIPLLVHHFVTLYAAENGKTIKGVDPSATNLLQSYDWPGNVRELENAIESAVVMCPGELVTTECLPQQVRSGPPEEVMFNIGMTLAEMERQAVEATLRATGGNKTLAAKMLGIGVRTIHDKLKRYEGQDRHNGQSAGVGAADGSGTSLA